MPPSAWNRDASPQLLAEIDADSTLNVIDTHTAGEPTRILLCADGFAPLDGETMLKRQIGATEHWEMMRRRLIHEPRGHGDMFGAVVLPPARQDCDAGVLFFDTGGFLAMCVHGSIAVSRVLVALGHRNSFLRLDTAAGPIESRVDPSGSVRGDCKIRKEAPHPRQRRPAKSMASSVATSSPNRAIPAATASALQSRYAMCLRLLQPWTNRLLWMDVG